jgi:type I restriction enzyme, S subunit
MKKYNSYKDSGVEWIGEIPNHWVKTKIKYISNLYTGNSLNDNQKELYESNNSEEIPYVSSKDIDVNYHTVNYNNGLRIPKENNPFKIGKKGSFLLCVEGGSSGRKMVFLEEDVCFVNKLCCFESKQNSKFQFYFIQSQQFQDKFKLSLTGLIGGVSISTLKDFEFSLPPLPEQKKVVEFLDDKTQKIDNLIQQKEKKIELLKEKRTSLINHVVTKGLNPNVEMKDSGFEWIGEIPKHWDIIRLRHLGSFQNGISKGSEFFGKGYPFMNYGDVYKNQVSPTIVEGKVESDEEERIRYSVLRGDVFFTRTSESKDDIGVSSTCLETIKDCCFSGFVIRFRFYNETHLPEYSRYHFQTHWKKVLIESKMNIVTRSSLSQQVLGDVPVLIPNKNEQQQIVQYLDEQTKEIDDLVQLEQKKIELLKEYRQSLISEVVTGKIRVCEEDLSEIN